MLFGFVMRRFYSYFQFTLLLMLIDSSPSFSEDCPTKIIISDWSNTIDRSFAPPGDTCDNFKAIGRILESYSIKLAIVSGGRVDPSLIDRISKEKDKVEVLKWGGTKPKRIIDQIYSKTSPACIFGMVGNYDDAEDACILGIPFFLINIGSMTIRKETCGFSSEQKHLDLRGTFQNWCEIEELISNSPN